MSDSGGSADRARPRSSSAPPAPGLDDQMCSNSSSKEDDMTKAMRKVAGKAVENGVARDMPRLDKTMFELSTIEFRQMLFDNRWWPQLCKLFEARGASVEEQEHLSAISNIIKATTDRNILHKAISGGSGSDRVRGEDFEDGDTRFSNDLEQNKARVKAGGCIRATQIDHKRSKYHDMLDLNYTSTPLGPASSKLYPMYVLAVVEAWALCVPFMTKGGQGWEAVDPEFWRLFTQVFPVGADYKLAEGATEALFSENVNLVDCQIIYLHATWVPLNTYIALEHYTLTPESRVRLHDLVLKNGFVKEHIGASLASIAKEDVDVEERAEQIRELGVPGPCEEIKLGEDGTLQKVPYVKPPPPKSSAKNGAPKAQDETQRHSTNRSAHTQVASSVAAPYLQNGHGRPQVGDSAGGNIGRHYDQEPGLLRERHENNSRQEAQPPPPNARSFDHRQMRDDRGGSGDGNGHRHSSGSYDSYRPFGNPKSGFMPSDTAAAKRKPRKKQAGKGPYRDPKPTLTETTNGSQRTRGSSTTQGTKRTWYSDNPDPYTEEQTKRLKNMSTKY